MTFYKWQSSDRTKDNEEIEKYSEKNMRIVYNSLYVCVCVCVGYICVLLCVDI